MEPEPGQSDSSGSRSSQIPLHPAAPAPKLLLNRCESATPAIRDNYDMELLLSSTLCLPWSVAGTTHTMFAVYIGKGNNLCVHCTHTIPSQGHFNMIISIRGGGVGGGGGGGRVER